jgi:sugar/nucleoside kinase (ribokinase family)
MMLAVGSIIIDDIVLPDGQTRMGMLGGNVPHAAMGIRAWREPVCLVAPAGPDLPETARSDLEHAFDLRGLARRDGPTHRAWQLIEHDGRRTEVFRTDPEEFRTMGVEPCEIPGELAGAAGAYLTCDVPEPFRRWVAWLRAGGCGCILWEPWIIFGRPENWKLFGELAPLVDAVSPNLAECRRLTGLDDPHEIVAALLRAGARAVALRMGAAGSLVAGQEQGTVPIPAFTVGPVVDQTGAGNAYCGGFLAGLVETGDVAQAGRYGAVSASFALEQFGAVYPLESLRARAEARLRTLEARR